MGVAICIPGILAERGDLHRVWGSDFVNSYFKEEVINITTTMSCSSFMVMNVRLRSCSNPIFR